MKDDVDEDTVLTIDIPQLISVSPTNSQLQQHHHNHHHYNSNNNNNNHSNTKYFGKQYNYITSVSSSTPILSSTFFNYDDNNSNSSNNSNLDNDVVVDDDKYQKYQNNTLFNKITDFLNKSPILLSQQQQQLLQQPLLEQQINSNDIISLDSSGLNNNSNNSNNSYDYLKIYRCTLYMVLLYLAYGLLQEFIFKKQEVNFFSLYSFSQFFISFLFSIKGLINESTIHILPTSSSSSPSLNSQQQQQHKNNQQHPLYHFLQDLSFRKLRLYIFLSLVLISTKILGNESLRFINYKTKVMFQSSKLIPVMIIGGILFRRSYNLIDYLSVMAMTCGLVFFSIGDSNSSLSFSPLGLLFIVGYVFIESIKSILYEKILRDFQSELELSLFTNFFGTVMSLPIVFVSGELKASILFFKDHLSVLLLLLAFILLGYYANITYLHLMRISDSFYANMISSFRKFITIIISFLFFKDTFLHYHAFGIVLFFLGLGLEMKHNYTSKEKIKV